MERGQRAVDTEDLLYFAVRHIDDKTRPIKRAKVRGIGLRDM
jgi:hypothetical protein